LLGAYSLLSLHFVTFFSVSKDLNPFCVLAPFRRHAAIMQLSCGNHAAIMRQSCGNHAAIMQQSCGNHAANAE
jgi:hypothetical protein